MEYQVLRTNENEHEQKNEKELRIINIMILGKSKVGKSFITCRLQGKELPLSYDATICDNYKFVLEEKSLLLLRENNILNQYCLNIIDTGDFKYSNDFGEMRNVDYFIIVYAIDDIDSFNYIKIIIDKINSKGVFPNDSNTLIVGNKSDTIVDRIQIKKLNALDKNFKQNIHLNIVEVSAVLNKDIDFIINFLIEREIEKYHPRKADNEEFCKCC
jgi:GTPase SAR1 family protein